MKKLKLIQSVILLTSLGLFVTNCQKDINSPQIKVQDITGFVQKGPFISGSSVIIYDLQPDITPNGKSYNTMITDNKGTFHIANIPLSSNYAALRADGFYYNEISGTQSASQITLYALSDVSGKNTLTINLLTHLEKARVEYLMKSGLSFSDSKSQAQSEILKIFGFQNTSLKSSEDLNIIQTGEDNGKLLAITAILQGNHYEGELTELLSNISEDIKTDGKLDNETLGSELVNQSRFLDTIAIKSNLIKRYNDLGQNPNVPVFGKYIGYFNMNTKFKFTNVIEYPENGKTGPNILAENKSDYTRASSDKQSCSVAAKLPRGAFIKVKLIPDSISGGDYDPIKHIQNPVIYAAWGLHMVIGEDTGWSGNYDSYVHGPVIENTNSERIIDTQIDLFSPGSGTIEIYENNQANPTRRKHIKW